MTRSRFGAIVESIIVGGLNPHLLYPNIHGRKGQLPNPSEIAWGQWEP